MRITDASMRRILRRVGLRKHIRIAANYAPANSNSVFGELIDDGFEVVRRPNTYFIDRASDHFRANIQYGHNTVRQSANETCNLVKGDPTERWSDSPILDRFNDNLRCQWSAACAIPIPGIEGGTSR